MEQFAEVFQDELGVLRGIEATVAINKSAIPHFYKARPVPFALKEKVERQLQQNTSWVWTSEHQKGIDAPKRMLSSVKALAHYDVKGQLQWKNYPTFLLDKKL